jgi:hypothetical protein
LRLTLRLGEELTRVEDVVGVEEALDGQHLPARHGVERLCQVVALRQSDAVLSGQRPSQRDGGCEDLPGRLTQLPVEVSGREPRQLALRGRSVTNKKMQGRIAPAPVRPRGAES